MQLHPDRNSAPNAKEQFQEVLEAYEILYEGRPLYKKPAPSYEPTGQPKARDDRGRRTRPLTAEERRKWKEAARRRHAEKMEREFRREVLRFDKFKKSFKYKLVVSYASFSLMLGVILLLDIVLPNKQEVVQIEDLYVEFEEISGRRTRGDFYVQICSQEMAVGYYTFNYLSGENYITAEYSPLAKNLEGIYVPSDRGMEWVDSNKVNLIPFMFLLTIFIFLAEGPSYAYYRIIEMTGVISLIALALFVMNGNGLFRLLGLYGC